MLFLSVMVDEPLQPGPRIVCMSAWLDVAAPTVQGALADPLRWRPNRLCCSSLDLGAPGTCHEKEVVSLLLRDSCHVGGGPWADICARPPQICHLPLGSWMPFSPGESLNPPAPCSLCVLRGVALISGPLVCEMIRGYEIVRGHRGRCSCDLLLSAPCWPRGL